MAGSRGRRVALRTHFIVLCAVVVWPLFANARPVRFTSAPPAADCKVQVASSAAKVVQTIECGAVANLANGSYAAWITYGNMIAARPTEVAIDDGSTVLEVALPPATVPAAMLAVQAAAEEIVDVVHLVKPIHNKTAPVSFCRVRVWGGATIVFPEGSALAIGRESGGAPSWLSDPFVVRAGMRNVIGPRQQRGDGAALLAEVRIPPGMNSPYVDVAPMTLGGEQPRMWGMAGDVILAVWYDLPTEPSAFAALADDWFVPRQNTALRPSKTSWIRAHAQELPTLSVFIDIERFGDVPDRLMINVRSDARKNPIEIAAEIGLNEVRNVPPDKLEVSLSMGKWKFTKEVDTSDGISRSVTFQLKPAIVTGKVTYRGGAARATVGFNGSDRYEVSTDDHGNFRTALWSQGRYGVAVALSDQSDLPLFTDTVRITGDRELNITVPATAVRARVVNIRTGDPIPDAFVMVKNTWVDQAEGERGNMVRIPTDEKGEAALPPLRVGTIELLAQAPGFAPGKPTKYTIASDVHAETIVIGLAEGGAAKLNVAFSDGRPAAAAVAAGFVNDRSVWTGTSDTEGNIVVPDGFDGRIAVRHVDAAGTILEWRAGTASAECQLDPAAPPLRLRVVNMGGEPVPGARIIVWSGDMRVEGNALLFLYQAPPSTSIDGIWPARGLPRQVRILALNRHSPDLLELQKSFATQFRSPWPTAPTIRVLN